MKFIKKFADWKTWVFFILPILLLIAWAAILIYADRKSINNPALIIFGQALLFTVAVLLLFSGVFTKFKRLTILGRISTIVFTACFVGLQVAAMILIPPLCAVNDKVSNLRDTFLEMTRDDPEYEQTHDAWIEAVKDQNDLSFKVKMLNSAGCTAIALSVICGRITTKDDRELSEQNDNNSNDNNCDDGERQA